MESAQDAKDCSHFIPYTESCGVNTGRLCRMARDSQSPFVLCFLVNLEKPPGRTLRDSTILSQWESSTASRWPRRPLRISFSVPLIIELEPVLPLGYPLGTQRHLAPKGGRARGEPSVRFRFGLVWYPCTRVEDRSRCNEPSLIEH